MQQLFESSFFMALGKAIAASIWQMGLLFLVYQGLISLFKIKQAAARNALSTIFSLGGFLWFAASFAYYFEKGTAASLVIENTAPHQQVLQQFTGNNNWQVLLNWTEYKFNLLLPYLSIAYLIVLFWFAARLLTQFLQTNALRSKGIMPVDGELQLLVTTLAQHLQLQKNIAAFISNRIDIPATIGFLKPVILLPAVAVTHLTPAQLEAVLLHELAHIRRNDYFWNLLLSITETLLFFNPFALLLIGIARKERENSCDDVVVQYKQNAAVYAEALMNVEKARILTPQLAMALGDNKHHLMHRVKRILNLPVEKNKYSARLLALLFFTIVFALMGWVLQNKKRSQQADSNTITATIKEGRPLFITPAALIQKENKTLSVKDNTKKINVEIRKEDKTKEYVLLNDDGEEYKFENLILEDLPVEWIEGFFPDKQQITVQHNLKEVKIHRLLQKDSAILKQRREQYRKMQEQYARAFSNNRMMREQTPQQPYVFYFDGRPAIDSVVEHFQKQPHQYNYAWKENAAIVTEEKEALTDKMKQTRKRMMQLAELSKRARAMELSRFKSFDSTVAEQLFFQSPPQPPAEWMALMEKPFADMQQHQQVTILIEDNKVFINGKPVVTDSVLQQMPKRKLLKVVEVMKL